MKLIAYDTTGGTVYAVLLDASGQAWNGGTFEALNPANWTDYDIALSEGAGGIYVAAVPAIPAGVYNYVAYRQAGANPAASDVRVSCGSFVWDGSAEVVATGDAYAVVTDVTHGNSALASAVAAIPTTTLSQQDARDALKLAPSAGDPVAGSVDKHLDDILDDTGTSGVVLADSAITSAKIDTTALQAFRDALKLAATSGMPTSGSIDKHLDDLLTYAASVGAAAAAEILATPANKLATDASGRVTPDTVTAAGPDEDTIATAVDDALTLTHGAGAWGAEMGAFSKVYTVTVGGVVKAGAYCRLCTDLAGTNSVSAGTTNSLGQVTFKHNLPAGTDVWVHVSLDGYEPLVDAETI